MNKYIFLTVIVLLVASPLYVNAIDWNAILNRSQVTGETSENFDTKNVILLPGDRQTLGLDSNAKAFLQKRSLKEESHVKGLNTDFANRLAKFFAAAESVGHGMKIYSGYRSPTHQARLFNDAVKKYGSTQAARKWVAPPGGSNHNRGIAADLKFSSAAAKDWAHKNAMQHGLYFRMAHEPWHIEPYGSVTQNSSSTDTQSSVPNNPQSTAKKAEEIGKKISATPSNSSGGQAQNTEDNQRNPYNIWGEDTPATSTISSVASISCTPGEVSGAERSLIEWRCSGPSTRSRGGTTQIQSLFDTKGSLSGKGYARPDVTTGYKVQCLVGDRVIDEATCKVDVSGATTSSVAQPEKPVLHISPKLPGVVQGGRTDVRWVTIGATNCVLRGGGVVVEGESGSIDTGKLSSDTTYVLQCDTSEGSKSVKAEVKII